MIRNFLLICLLGCGISLATAGNPPFFTTGTAVNEKGELLMTQKGTRQLDVFAADGKTLLRSYPFKETDVYKRQLEAQPLFSYSSLKRL